MLLSVLQKEGGFHTFIAEESKGAIRNVAYLSGNPARQDIEGSPGVCEVVASEQGPLSFMPAILLIRVNWTILHTANVICATTDVLEALQGCSGFHH